MMELSHHDGVELHTRGAYMIEGARSIPHVRHGRLSSVPLLVSDAPVLWLPNAWR